jgi:hypothetical protein
MHIYTLLFSLSQYIPVAVAALNSEERRLIELELDAVEDADCICGIDMLDSCSTGIASHPHAARITPAMCVFVCCQHVCSIRYTRRRRARARARTHTHTHAHTAHQMIAPGCICLLAGQETAALIACTSAQWRNDGSISGSAAHRINVSKRASHSLSTSAAEEAERCKRVIGTA